MADTSILPVTSADQLKPPDAAAPAAALPATALPQQDKIPPAGRAPSPIPPMHHDSIMGRAVRSLFGSRVDYQVNDKGETVAVPTKEAPGQIFRHILAGAILGGAVGAHEKSFAGGVTAGGAAVQQKEQEWDAQRRQNAEQEFRNKTTAKREQREEDNQQSEETLRKAQIAHFNALTAQENQMIQGENFTQHQKVAENGRLQIEPYLEAGIKPMFKDIPESEMHQIIQKNSGASGYLWEPTGTKVVVGADGKPGYELTYSAVDPKGQVAVTPGLLKLFKDVEMEKYYPGISNYLKPGKQISATEMIVLQHEYQDLQNKQFDRNKQKLDLKEKEAQIRHYNAESARAAQEIAKSKLETKQTQLFGEALNELNKVGGDFSKLSPKSKVVISESANKLIGDMNSAITAAVNSGQEDEAKKLMEQRDHLISLATQALTSTSGAPTASAGGNSGKVDAAISNAQKAGNTIGYDYIEAIPSLSPQEKLEMVKRTGANIPMRKINEMAQKAGVTPEQMIKQLKDQGFNVDTNRPAPAPEGLKNP